MVHSILKFPHRPPEHRPVTTGDHVAFDSDAAILTHQLWRRLPAEAFGESERAALQDLLGATRPFGVAHWPEACAGDAAAAVAMALKLSGVDVLDTVRHDLVMTMLLSHALAGSAAARSIMAFTLARRRYLGEDVDTLVRSWQSPSRADIRRASIQALVEALS